MNTCWIPFLTWLSVCMQPVLMQNVNWKLNTKEPTCGADMELLCTVQNYACCNQLTRVWTKIVSGVTTEILNNGGTNFPDKYEERIDSANSAFFLKIKKMNVNDVNIDYNCVYGNNFQATLTVNENFTCYPNNTECPMLYTDKKIVGTLNITKLTPLPSLDASFGKKNYTGYFGIPKPVSGYPSFYTIDAYVNVQDECKNQDCPTFTMTVTTGKVTTVICKDYDICECKICGGTNYGWSVLGTTSNSIGMGIVFFACTCLCCLIVLKKYKESKFAAYKKSEKCGSVFIVFVFSAIYSFPVAYCIGYFIVNCHDGTSPSFIACGFGLSLIFSIIVLYLMSDGKDVWFIFLCLLTLGLYLLCKPDDKDSRYISFCVLTCGLYLLCKKQGSKSGNGKTYEPTRRDSPCHNLEDMN